MAARSLNKVMLIGNLTRDPELRYTPQGTAVCTMGLATNRTWVTDSGEKREETEWHRIVAWNKLAELCSQLLFKGRRIYVEGRLQTRQWTAPDGTQRQATEIVIEDMIILDSRRQGEEPYEEAPAEEPAAAAVPATPVTPPAAADTPAPAAKKGKTAKKTPPPEAQPGPDEVADDIPF